MWSTEAGGGTVADGASVSVGETPPSSATEGDLWWNSSADNGRMYVYYDGQWVESSPQGGGSSDSDGITEGVADARYLSKTSDDTAAGAITFEGLTTHEAGVSVTGGTADGVTDGLIYTSEGLAIVEDSTEQVLIGNPANIISIGGTCTDRALHVNTVLEGDRAFQGIRITNQVQDTAANYQGIYIEAPGGSGTVSGAVHGVYIRNNFQDLGSSTYGIYSGVGVGSSGDNYNFYAAGSAPNYFAGATLFGSVNTSMANDAGTENGWVFSPAGRASSHCTLATVNDNNASFKMWKHDSRTGRFISFHYSNAIGNGGDSVCGYIVQTSANSVEYEKTSDYRLKENIVDLPNATERVKAIKPYQYNFKNEPGVIHEGFVAHELQEHTVLAVSGEKDATEVFGTYTDVDGNVETNVTEPATIPAGSTFEPQGTRDVYQGVAPSALIPLLTKALQEVIAKNEDLEQRLAALEGGTN